MFTYTFLYFATVAVITAAAINCSNFDFHSDSCISTELCYFCCTTDKCFDELYPKGKCPQYAVLSKGDGTCGNICQSRKNCSACVTASFCRYCSFPSCCLAVSSTDCKVPLVAKCPGASVALRNLYRAAIYLSIAVSALVVVVLLTWLCRKYRTNYRSPPRNEDRREQRPLLGGGSSPANQGQETENAAEQSQLTITDDDQCQLCLERRAEVAFLPCYHAYCCEECSEKIKPNSKKELMCPFCRTQIESMVNISMLLHAEAHSKS